MSTQQYLDMYSARPRRCSDFPYALASLIKKDASFGDHVLFGDFGAGHGAFAEAWAKMHTPALVRTLDWNLIAPLPDVNHVNLSSIPQVRGVAKSFDVLLCKSVIEHVSDPKRMLNLIKKLMHRKSVAVFMTPDWRYTYQVFQEDPTHVHPYDLRGLTDCLKMHGFKILRTRSLYQHNGLDNSIVQQALAGVYSLFVSQKTACQLADWTGWQWLRWAKLRTAYVMVELP